MKTMIALALFGLVLAGTAAADPAPAPPWATVADLEQSVTQVFEVAGCGDTRPIGLLVVVDGPDTYFLIVSADARWAIMGPADAGQEPRIWYGTVLDGGRLLVERALVGTPATDVCPFLTRRSA